MLKDIVIFLGPPGSGKGSLSQLFVKRLGWVQLSTGNLCREHIAHQTEIGKQIDFAIKSGKLITDSLIIDMVQDWMLAHDQGVSVVILDGFPRTVAQADALQKLLTEKYPNIRVSIIQLVLPQEKIVERLASRRICGNNKCQAVYSLAKDSQHKPKKDMECDLCCSALIRRADDEEESIQQRLKLHYENEQALLEYYKKINQPITTCNVDQPLENVYQQLLNIMGYNPHD